MVRHWTISSRLAGIGLRRFWPSAMLAFWCQPALGAPWACDQHARLSAAGKPYILIAASPEKGFNFPYVLYVPSTALEKPFPYLVVEPDNSGVPSEDIAFLSDDAAKLATKNAMAERLGAPMLVPVFPRPKKGDSDLYTHSLSRETIQVLDGPLRRIDIQLVAILKDARAHLSACGISVHRRVMMTGFSASGMFASRFTFLHPDEVAAAAFGGVNGFVTLPLEDFHGTVLPFPLGLSDYRKITGHAFDRSAFDEIPQLAFMGENDTNDAAMAADDAYSQEEITFIHEALGARMLPDRWNAVQRAYQRAGSAVNFKTYDRLGHSYDERVVRDVVQLFLHAANDSDPQ